MQTDESTTKADPYLICVIFGLTKGEGVWPTPDQLTDEERKDPRTFCYFTLELDDEESSVDPDIIRSCTVLYDGVSALQSPSSEGEIEYGLRVAGNELRGQIRPIIEFTLTQPVDHEKFRRLVWGSSYCLSPSCAEEPFSAEDWNDYTEVLSRESKDAWVRLLHASRCFSGETFEPAQLQKGISAMQLGRRKS